MAVFRVEKTRDFTVMSNHHLRNPRLSLKAKGLLSLMLSLPEDWDYTTKGLAYICKDGIDAISTTLRELEEQGYLTRERVRMANGRLGTVEYTIHEQPQKPIAEPFPPKRENPVQVNPVQVFPDQVFPEQDYPEQENPVQLNKDIQSTDRPNKDKSTDKKDKTRVRAIREQIKDNIEYDILVERYGADKLDALVELMLEAIISDHPYCIISKEKLPRDMVRSQLLKIDSSHIEFVLDELNETTSKVGNTRAYVLSALFNAPANMDNHYQFEVNHDYPMHRRRRKA